MPRTQTKIAQDDGVSKELLSNYDQNIENAQRASMAAVSNSSLSLIGLLYGDMNAAVIWKMLDLVQNLHTLEERCTLLSMLTDYLACECTALGLCNSPIKFKWITGPLNLLEQVSLMWKNLFFTCVREEALFTQLVSNLRKSIEIFKQFGLDHYFQEAQEYVTHLTKNGRNNINEPAYPLVPPRAALSNIKLRKIKAAAKLPRRHPFDVITDLKTTTPKDKVSSSVTTSIQGSCGLDKQHQPVVIPRNIPSLPSYYKQRNKSQLLLPTMISPSITWLCRSPINEMLPDTTYLTPKSRKIVCVSPGVQMRSLPGNNFVCRSDVNMSATDQKTNLAGFNSGNSVNCNQITSQSLSSLSVTKISDDGNKMSNMGVADNLSVSSKDSEENDICIMSLSSGDDSYSPLAWSCQKHSNSGQRSRRHSTQNHLVDYKNRPSNHQVLEDKSRYRNDAKKVSNPIIPKNDVEKVSNPIILKNDAKMVSNPIVLKNDAQKVFKMTAELHKSCDSTSTFGKDITKCKKNRAKRKDKKSLTTNFKLNSSDESCKRFMKSADRIKRTEARGHFKRHLPFEHEESRTCDISPEKNIHSKNAAKIQKSCCSTTDRGLIGTSIDQEIPKRKVIKAQQKEKKSPIAIYRLKSSVKFWQHLKEDMKSADKCMRMETRGHFKHEEGRTCDVAPEMNIHFKNTAKIQESFESTSEPGLTTIDQEIPLKQKMVIAERKEKKSSTANSRTKNSEEGRICNSSPEKNIHSKSTTKLQKVCVSTSKRGLTTIGQEYIENQFYRTPDCFKGSSHKTSVSRQILSSDLVLKEEGVDSASNSLTNKQLFLPQKRKQTDITSFFLKKNSR